MPVNDNTDSVIDILGSISTIGKSSFALMRAMPTPPLCLALT